ncbi:MAG: hypothetical protein AMJ46_10815 [Latescibacteria bacterium DG_63]|nr:MAG: hypothetical protein AMJ46_10815 [Latescibacteria bacterium DG_63]
MRKATVWAVVLVHLITGYAVAHELKVAQIVRHEVPSFVGYVSDQLIVEFTAISNRTAGTSSRTGLAEMGVASLDAIAEQFNVTEIRPLFPGAEANLLNGRLVDISRYHKVTFEKAFALTDLMEAYRGDPNVVSVEPIGIHTVGTMPNDGYFNRQWHLNQTNDCDVDAPEAWDIETGDTSITVAILDTGVRYFHKDLGGSNASYSTPAGTDGNMWINWAEKDGAAGVDDDGNGYVDDWVGYDFVENETNCWTGEDCSGKDSDPRDFNGHGTHCAGNVSAINNNGYATCAASGGWGNGTLEPSGNGVKIMACRIGWSGRYLGLEAGFVRMDYAAEAFYYAADKGAKIASCSWGSGNTGGIEAAIDYFLAHGGIIFKAAGNDGSETADYMCGRTDIIAVAATDSNDCKADFSNFGTWVDVSAPGTRVWSSYHSHNDPEFDYVASMYGTSMATPVAASVAALIWSKNPSWAASQVKDGLFEAADPIDGLACNSSYVGKLGVGRVNAFNAVYDPPPLVSVVTPNGGESIVAGSYFDITWTAIDESGVDSVTILYSVNGGASFDTIATGEPNDSVYTWHVLAAYSDSCLVRVIAYDSYLNAGQDDSDDLFAIVERPEVPAFNVTAQLITGTLVVVTAALLLRRVRRRKAGCVTV